MDASTGSRAEVPRLELRGISKRFGAVQALADVDFEVHQGEVVGLVGDNGAGKSTLIKAIAGIHSVDAGTIRFDGEVVTINSPTDSTALGISTVYQDLALCDNLDVVANLHLGRERKRHLLGGTLDEVAMERRSLEVLAQLSVTVPNIRVPVASLSGGQRQSVAVARSVMWDAKVLLLDEPTAALGVAQTAQVLGLIRRLREQQMAVVVISHNLADVFEVVDRIIVLRLGRRVGSFDVRTTDSAQVVAAITGAEFGRIGAKAAIQ